MSLRQRPPRPVVRACCVVLAALAALSGPVHAGERPQPAPMSEAELASYLPEGGRIETRLDADVTGDGLRDIVFVAGNEDVRVLKVLAAYADAFNMGFEPVGEAKMGGSPLGSAGLSVKKGVLIVEDLDGGTTAIQSLYRYRYDPKVQRMRLIGDDVSLYSRTNAHDSVSISTNRLTGVQIRKDSVVGADGYTDKPEVKSKVSAKPIYMEDAPLPQQTLEFGD